MKILSDKISNLKTINLILKHIEVIRVYCRRGNPNYYKNILPEELHETTQVSNDEINIVNPDSPVQGKEGLVYEVYKLPNGYYLKMTVKTDSYGYNEHISSLEFVLPKQKEITVFEEI